MWVGPRLCFSAIVPPVSCPTRTPITRMEILVSPPPRAPARPPPRAPAHLGGQVLQDGRAVHRRGGSHSAVAGGSGLQVSVDSTHWELQRHDEVSCTRMFDLFVEFVKHHRGNEWMTFLATNLQSCSLWPRDSFRLCLPGIFTRFSAGLEKHRRLELPLRQIRPFDVQ